VNPALSALPFAFALAAPLFAQSPAGADGVTVLRGARILPVGAAPIDGGMLIIAGGKVQAVGKGLSVPEGARVIDLAGGVITPGLVDAAAQLLISARDLNEQGEEVTPAVKIVDAIDPADQRLRRARRAGVTTVHLAPGNRNVIGGLGAVLKTHGEWPQMLLREDASLRLTLGTEPSQGNRGPRGGASPSIYNRRPNTRMGVIFTARKAFYDAKAYADRTLLGTAEPNAALDVLVRALQKKLTVVTTARAEQDIRTALRLADEFGYLTVLDEVVEAHRVVQLLAESKVSVLVGAPSQMRVAGSGAQDGGEPRWSTVLELDAAGVPYAICTGTNQGSLELVHEALFSVRNGLSPERALQAVTLTPATILGVGDRVGSLAPGKDADFVVWTGDPFDPTTTAAAVYVDGKEIG
jgi:imidazolonepropionase-like amidohydrolase